mgnify:CR=1 FL=1|tara:strand:+ start:18963 stop:19661 length:699 start_codon:yes stop_codon:yes gene_type:complete
MAHIFFDFDSTLVCVETLDALIESALNGDAQKIEEIQKITALGMQGDIPLIQSLKSRLNTVEISQRNVDLLSKNLTKNITDRMADIIKCLQNNGHKTYILSGGFIDYMMPVAQTLNIAKEQIFANTFHFNKEGYITGFKEDNPLCKNGGKGKLIQGLNLKEPIIMVGDGMTDLEVFTDGLCHDFIGFGLHAKRDIIKEKAPYFVENIADFEKVLEKILSKKYETQENKERTT